MATREEIRAALLQLKHVPPAGSIAEARARLDALPDPANFPAGTRVERTTAGGRPAEWLSPPDAAPDRVILYLHGGAYCIGSCASHRELAARLAGAAGARALVVEYRLAPEHRFPAAVEDAVATYRWLLDRDVAPGRIVLAGDSAGGGLAVATLVALRAAGAPLPAGAAMISPWADLAGTSPSLRTRAEADPWLTPERLAQRASLYLGDADPRAPLASPVYADLRGLPPLLILAGGDEIVLDDAARLAERARAAGVPVALEVYAGMWHVWPLWAADLPEGERAVGQIGAFVRQLTA
jgi:monoterpene epsilon-lactone hydrolase